MLPQGLKDFISDKEFLDEWMQVKQENKARLAVKIKNLCNVEVNTSALFDIQVCTEYIEYRDCTARF